MVAVTTLAALVEAGNMANAVAISDTLMRAALVVMVALPTMANVMSTKHPSGGKVSLHLAGQLFMIKLSNIDRIP